MELTNSGIGEKVCKTKNGRTKDGTKSYGTYAPETDRTSEDVTATALCGGKGGNNATGAAAQQFKDFVTETLVDGSQNWPTSKDNGKAGGRANVKSKPNDNAEAVAKDLVQELTPEEKTIVAGLLAKTIEGGEVVEIRAVSSTSVMVNACYDLLSEGLGVVPYACVGLGGNFVGVVDGTRRTIRL
ncbi:surface antigen family protein [Anaplasma phagocytophilum str. ApMUC09]|uniref:Surface antigen family protein n=1 Tax=Anaplasma phagocytophilum str. ApMUC09 TaxID=1359152 RepID=A0A0F3NA86_ANAPH|nr:surface antigen family protein [Anaplasma phagocytophilum str. ApMUC09]KJV65003.1 surface antigen family protein [Anaplasma phagocytophilum str. ApMUC09]